MEPHNSLVRFYRTLVIGLYRDIAECYDVALRVQNVEIEYISARLEKEGLSFLTKALPRLGKAVDTALSSGTRLSIQGFTLDGAIPKFLGWLLSRVFDPLGVELVNSNSLALKHFRQFVYLLYKLKIPHDEAQEQSVVSSFEQVDQELPRYAETCWNHILVPKAREIISRIFGTVDGTRIKPGHGPGSVATGESTTEKSKFSRLYTQLEQEYPFTEYFCFSLSHVCDDLDRIQALEVLDKPTAKVVLVPKDSRGPRLISAEPLEIQWIQQGLGPLLESAINRHWLSAGFVNFEDQSINGRLALSGSKDGQWVTLDMKDASDRVSSDLVKSLFTQVPRLLAQMLACRSTHTRLPDGRIVALNKFAPMGSRLCFPVEAICFYALILSALQMNYHCSLRKLVGRVFIFGDDIIMRQEDYSAALQSLPLFGLMFNKSKCCTHGFFRESCGVDAHKGANVTPSRLKTVWCDRRRTPEVLCSYVAFRNAMTGRGYLRVARLVERALGRVYGKIPYTNAFHRHPNGAYETTVDSLYNGGFSTTSGAPAYASDEAPAERLNQGMRVRFSPTHTYQVFTWQSVSCKQKADEDNWFGLLRRHSNDYGARGGVYALPRRNRLKRGWTDLS